MPKARQHRYLFTCSPLYILLFVLCLTTGINPLPSFANTSADIEKTVQSLDGSTPAEINEILADLDDNQVRQLLKQELNKNGPEDSISLTNEIPGPGSFLSSMLRSLTITSSQSKDRVKQLLAGLPKVFPDLYKVFLTL